MLEECWFRLILNLPEDRCSILQYSRRVKINNITITKKLRELEQKQLLILNTSHKKLSALEIQLTDKGKQFKDSALKFAEFLR